jgi:hypothetical protein
MHGDLHRNTSELVAVAKAIDRHIEAAGRREQAELLP